MASMNLSVNNVTVRKRIDVVDFVTAYMEADSVQSVADKLGVAKKDVYIRAGNLRSRGVNLKKFPSGRKKINIQALNKLIRSLSN